MDRAGVQSWIDGYERAWRTAGTALLGELFAPAATYRTAPYEPPFEGLPAIAELWESGRDGPDETFTMSAEIVAVEGDHAVVRVEVHYGEPQRQSYRDLWVLRFGADGRCAAFEEWPFWPPGSGGGWIRRDEA
jgi:hypothetical protein